MSVLQSSLSSQNLPPIHSFILASVGPVREIHSHESALCYLKLQKNKSTWFFSGSVIPPGRHQQRDVQAGTCTPSAQTVAFLSARSDTIAAIFSARVNKTVVDRWLTWMVHVYSVSSSSLTVQLYSRSRFLMLPLINRLNIFSENRCSASRTRTINSTPACKWMSQWPQFPVP